jgi:hypothetical protein
MTKVTLRVHFAVPPHDIDVVWHVAKFPRLGEISRHKREEYGDGKAEPEVCRVEEEEVVTEGASGEPTGRNYRINRLEYSLAYLACMYERSADLRYRPTQVQYRGIRQRRPTPSRH